MGLFNFLKTKSYTDELMQQSQAGQQWPGQQPGQQEVVQAAAPVAGELLTVQDVFLIKGRGVVVTGRVVAPIRLGQSVVVRGARGDLPATVLAVEAAQQNVESVDIGNDAGIMLSGVERDQIMQGDKLFVA